MGYLEDNTKTGRELFPDLVRAFALIGIALVNVGVIAYPMMESYHGGGFRTPLDTSFSIVVNSIFTFKSYTLFSFMFGVGFAYQFASAKRKGVKFGRRYTRRIIGLAVLGLLHVAFLFQGDILFVYAVLGCALYFFRKAQVKTLIWSAIGIYIFQLFLITLSLLAVDMGIKFAPEEMAKELAKMEASNARSLAIYGDGTFTQSIEHRFKEWGQVISFGLIAQGFGAFSFFLFGFAAVESGIINKSSAPIWRKFRRIYLPIGLAGSVLGALVMSSGSSVLDSKMMLGFLLIATFAPLSTAGYLGLIAKWASCQDSAFRTFMARGGTSTLTAYLMQGLILSLIFNTYGLGYYAKFGAAVCILIALATASFTIIFTSLWRAKFQRGPMEFLLRRWTYLCES